MQNSAAAIAQLPAMLYAYLSKNQKGRFIMKISACYITISLLTIHLLVASPGMGQDMNEKMITLELQNESLGNSLAKIGKLSGFRLAYPSELVSKYNGISLLRNSRTVSVTLDLILSKTNLTYKQVDNKIIIYSNDIPVTDSSGNFATYYQVAADTAVTGIIYDVANGQPMENVSVTVKGTKLGTTSDLNGHFRLSLPYLSGVLVVSFTGYQEQLFVLNGKTSFRIALQKAENKLDEVIVVGYGTSSKRKNTGSVSSVTAEEISDQPVGNALNALQGRIAGAVVTQANGLPGARVTVQVRGRNSLNNGQQPLYIVDGVPFNIQDQAVPSTNDANSFGIFAANRGISPFAAINPTDIERIDVLKDADATAIYGTRGAHGVVLITTKKGKAGKTKLDINVYQGAGKVGKFIDMMSLPQYLEMRREAMANDGVTADAANAPDLKVWDTTKSIDWQKKYLGGTANTTDAQATVSGGDARTRFLLNAGYHRETTVFPGDFNDARISARFNAEHNSLDRKFNATLTASYSSERSNLLGTDLSGAVYNLPPNMPLYNADGTLYWNANFTNPESYLVQKYIGRTNNLISNATLRYTILPGLDVKANLGFNRISLDQNQQTPASTKNPLTTTLTNSARFATMDQETYIVEPQLTYTKDIWDGKLLMLAGGSWQQSVNKGTSIAADNYSNPSLLGTLSGAGTLPTFSTSYTLYKYNAVFGRLNYEWRSKYIFNATFRRDGSSRFGPGKRFGNFGSVGSAWIFSNEDFMAKALPFISFGKLRASYGVTGSDQIQDYQYITLFNTSSGTSSYQGSSVLSPARLNNPNLHWETTRKMELGLELGFFKDRILLTTSYYRNRSDDQLGYLSLGTQAGFNAFIDNFHGLVQNTGVEFELNTINVKTKDFTWSSAFNLTIPKTTLLEVDTRYFSYSNLLLGQPLSIVFRYNYKGVDPLTGRPLYQDLTRDTLTFTPSFNTDRAIAGYNAPSFYGGLTNTFTYKGFELNFFLQFTKQEGNILTSSAPGVLFNGNQNTNWLNRWRKPDDATALPKATTNSGIYGSYGSSDAIWGDASFARLRNLTLSYSLPASVTSRLRLSQCRVYIQGQNLYTWTKNKYVSDPETITTINQSPVVMPPLRVITAGINVSL